MVPLNKVQICLSNMKQMVPQVNIIVSKFANIAAGDLI